VHVLHSARETDAPEAQPVPVPLKLQGSRGRPAGRPNPIRLGANSTEAERDSTVVTIVRNKVMTKRCRELQVVRLKVSRQADVVGTNISRTT